ncbi:HAD-like domain-containing protein [Cunninghamella echinulata]|nr:HAD-like domain-containing protein [Cunninghamella echinulata]
MTLNKSEKKNYSSSNIKEKEPTEEYLKISKEQLSNTLETPIDHDKQLLILDLNGTLVSRTGKTGLYVRPYDEYFFDYIFSHFYVIVWSSAQPHNVAKMCKIFGKYETKLQLIWTRKNFDLTEEEYNSKTITIKDLRKIWQHLPQFNATNTILLDDSPKKTILQPFNHVIISEFNHLDQSFRKKEGDSSGGENELIYIKDYLDKLKYQDNVANYIFQYPYQSSLNKDNNNNDTLLSKYPKSTLCRHFVFYGNGVTRRPTIRNLSVEELTFAFDKIKL